jgi:hypothetical protein
MTPFKEFTNAQTHVNGFFWSTELSYEIVRQLVLAPLEKEERQKTVYALFHQQVKANAFVETTKQRRLRRDGKKADHHGHYDVKIGEFEHDLKKDIEHASLYVLLHFHTMLENFLRKRLGEVGFTAQQCKALWRSYPDLPKLLEQNAVTLRAPLSQAVLWRAEIFRTLRNIVTHEKIDLRPTPWSHRTLLKKLQAKKCPVYAVDEVCMQAGRSAHKSPDLPLLFFYALYCLTNYNDFAREINKSLPTSRAVQQQSQTKSDAFQRWYDGLTQKFRKGLPQESAKRAWNAATETAARTLESLLAAESSESKAVQAVRSLSA